MQTTNRIGVVDSLRGFAVIGIIIIHFLEHLNFYSFPEPTAFDQGLWDTVFYLGASKMYAIFALLFGLSCYIMHHNQEKRGYDFRPRFAWRMLLLFLWGMLDLVFFNGDILCTYAVIGLLLIPLVKASDKVLWAVIVLMAIQPIEVAYEVMGLLDPSTAPMFVDIGSNWGACYEACRDGGFLDVAKANLLNGLQINFGWAIAHGRLTQTLLMFCIGLLVGRKRLFINEENHLATWRRILTVAVVVFAVMQLVLMNKPTCECAAIANSLDIQLNAWSNLALTLIYVSSITLLYYCTRAYKVLEGLKYIGKMSLTNYLLQSAVGGFLFYHWGLNLHTVCRHSYSFVLAIVFLIVLHFFCRYWTTHHRRGPLEELWHRATWWGGEHRS